MILEISANDPRFKSVSFKPGFNVVLADRSAASGKRDTRNGAGKTTLIHTIHYCLGAEPRRLMLPWAEIPDWTFTIKLILNGQVITASRAVANHSKIIIDGDAGDFPVKPETDEGTGQVFYSNTNWKTLLGICLFRIPSTAKSGSAPSFRSLIPYFVRKNKEGFLEPFKHFRTQKKNDTMVWNAFLVGLNWETVSDACKIDEKQKLLKKYNDAARAGVAQSLGELESERVQLESSLATATDAIAKFRVHPMYSTIQDRANQLTLRINEASNQLFVQKQRLVRYLESAESENAPDELSIAELYEEAGLIFPDLVLKTLEEAKQFHASIVRYRAEYLRAEAIGIERRIADLEGTIASSSDERAELMETLRTHGALEDYTKMQMHIANLQANRNEIVSKIRDQKDRTNRARELRAQMQELEARILHDYEERRPHWEDAVSVFQENTRALYSTPGKLIIDPSDYGYSFKIEIPRSGSDGVENMKIFCYDLMLAEVMSRSHKIDFVVHDSILFDGVDSRQRAHALQLAKEKSLAGGLQYICLLNSDQIPSADFDAGFNIAEDVRLVLGDRAPSDHLMGFRYDISDLTHIEESSIEGDDGNQWDVAAVNSDIHAASAIPTE